MQKYSRKRAGSSQLEVRVKKIKVSANAAGPIRRGVGKGCRARGPKDPLLSGKVGNWQATRGSENAGTLSELDGTGGLGKEITTS